MSTKREFVIVVTKAGHNKKEKSTSKDLKPIKHRIFNEPIPQEKVWSKTPYCFNY